MVSKYTMGYEEKRERQGRGPVSYGKRQIWKGGNVDRAEMDDLLATPYCGDVQDPCAGASPPHSSTTKWWGNCVEFSSDKPVLGVGMKLLTSMQKETECQTSCPACRKPRFDPHRHRKERERKEAVGGLPQRRQDVIFWKEMFTDVFEQRNRTGLVYPQSVGCRMWGASLLREEPGILGWEVAGNWVELLALTLRAVFNEVHFLATQGPSLCWLRWGAGDIACVLNKRRKCIYDKNAALVALLLFHCWSNIRQLILFSFPHHQNPSLCIGQSSWCASPAHTFPFWAIWCWQWWCLCSLFTEGSNRRVTEGWGECLLMGKY